MSESNSTAKEIDLGSGFGDVAVKANGIRVELHADGSVAAYTQKDVDAYTSGAVHLHPAVNDDNQSAAKVGTKPGDRMADGTVYAGISPDTGKAMYATPADAPLTYTFNQAQKYAAKLEAHGHQDWRVPTKKELDVLFNNRAAIGGFNVTGSDPAGWYWSSSQNFFLLAWAERFSLAWAQRFSDGDQSKYGYKDDASSLRCVRG
jgi:hypothetical protein